MDATAEKTVLFRCERHNRSMRDQETAKLLKSNGFEIGDPAIRDDGQLLVQINNVFMFPRDAEDLAHGRATLPQVIARNKGKVFPDATDQ